MIKKSQKTPFTLRYAPFVPRQGNGQYFTLHRIIINYSWIQNIYKMCFKMLLHYYFQLLVPLIIIIIIIIMKVFNFSVMQIYNRNHCSLACTSVNLQSRISLITVQIKTNIHQHNIQLLAFQLTEDGFLGKFKPIRFMFLFDSKNSPTHPRLGRLYFNVLEI